MEEKKTIDEEQSRLLQKMIERQEKDILISRITAIAECALLAVLVIVFGILVPKFFKTVARVEESMDRVDMLVADAETALTDLTGLAEDAEVTLGRIKTLAQDADTVLQDNDEALTQAIDNFNSVDFESLNRSISHIADVIEPIVELLQKWK